LEANHAQRKVFSFFSRETRNPLQAIRGALSVIRRRADPRDEPLAQAVGIIGEEIRQLNDLVQEYLDFLRPVEGIQVVPVDLNALLTLVLTIMQNNHNGSSPPVSVVACLDSALPPVAASYEEVKRAFLYIIKNSYAALSEKGGSLTVETRFFPAPVPGFIDVALTENGPGLERENLAPIFTPCVVSSPRANGLGLAISRRIIVEHCQGNIRVEKAAGGGRRLLVSLPMTAV
jgi:signal transduction histidine kinase